MVKKEGEAGGGPETGAAAGAEGAVAGGQIWAGDGSVGEMVVHKRHLEAMATAHEKTFMALAELVDNAYDPNCAAKNLSIAPLKLPGFDGHILAVKDDGAGLSPQGLKDMMNLGFTNKGLLPGEKDYDPIGMYGSGFKSGSMRLGQDVLVVTADADSLSVSLLSLTMHEEKGWDKVRVPRASFPRCALKDPEPVLVAARQQSDSLRFIFAHTPFLQAANPDASAERLLERFRDLAKDGGTGTHLFIFNLGKDIIFGDGDIRWKPADPNPDLYTTSFRAYASVLYLRPRLKIWLCGKRVSKRLIDQTLLWPFRKEYRPKGAQGLPNTGKAIITVGVKQRSLQTAQDGQDVQIDQVHGNSSGITIYYRNRLIQPYKDFPSGLWARASFAKQLADIVVVVEADFLTPDQSKKHFTENRLYLDVSKHVADLTKRYLQTVQPQMQAEEEEAGSDHPLDIRDWISCDKCTSFRSVSKAYYALHKDDVSWYCSMNPEPDFDSCDVPEEVERIGEKTLNASHCVDKRCRQREKAEKTKPAGRGPKRSFRTVSEASPAPATAPAPGLAPPAKRRQLNRGSSPLEELPPEEQEEDLAALISEDDDDLPGPSTQPHPAPRPPPSARPPPLREPKRSVPASQMGKGESSRPQSQAPKASQPASEAPTSPDSKARLAPLLVQTEALEELERIQGSPSSTSSNNTEAFPVDDPDKLADAQALQNLSLDLDKSNADLEAAREEIRLLQEQRLKAEEETKDQTSKAKEETLKAMEETARARAEATVQITEAAKREELLEKELQGTREELSECQRTLVTAETSVKRWEAKAAEWERKAVALEAEGREAVAQLREAEASLSSSSKAAEEGQKKLEARLRAELRPECLAEAEASFHAASAAFSETLVKAKAAELEELARTLLGVAHERGYGPDPAGLPLGSMRTDRIAELLRQALPARTSSATQAAAPLHTADTPDGAAQTRPTVLLAAAPSRSGSGEAR